MSFESDAALCSTFGLNSGATISGPAGSTSGSEEATSGLGSSSTGSGAAGSGSGRSAIAFASTAEIPA